jgi:hypothetical protein
MRLHLIASAILASTAFASADITQSPNSWLVDPNFKGHEARGELSGVACAAGSNQCLMVNDEKKYAQFFTIDGTNIIPGEPIRLLPSKIDSVNMNDFDGEAAAFVSDGEQSYYYIIGSHGLTGKGRLHPSVFHLFRFPVDGDTGRPAFAFDENDTAPDIERTALLRGTIKGQAFLAPYAEQRLQQNGVSVEGMAILDGQLLIGFREPVLYESAFVMRVPVSELFGELSPPGYTTPLPLGWNTGIRDLAGVTNGVLILAGQSSRETAGAPVTPSIWFWSGKDADTPKKVGELPGVAGDRKPEGLLVLEETDMSYRVLVIFDGAKNGGPIEFILQR